MKRLLLLLAPLSLVSLWACPGPIAPPQGNETSCVNGADDNGDGKADCDDPQCSTHPSCQSMMTPDAGKPCTGQAECLAVSYVYDDPLPACVASKCQKNAKGVDLRFEVDVAALAGLSWNSGALNTRFILKRAVDGSAVSCATLKALATGKTADKAAQLEASKSLNLLAFDVTKVAPPSASSIVIQPFLNTGVGADFIIWTEVWNGPPATDTKLPSGVRLGYGCTETGAPVDEIRPEHDWPNGASTGTSRTVRVRITDVN